ncbi:MAG: HU family DNA-binding protein, partial [Bacteroidales bacterium]|nr:HU family DNA-binding protein [Bacteroidales bacterium]
MNNKEFIAALAERTGCTLRESDNRVRSLVKAMADQLTQGNQVNVPSFGIFGVKKKNERISVHPIT